MSQKTITLSWFDRVKQSFGGLVFGLMLVVAMVGLLFWNEGRAVQTERSLAEGAGLVVSINPGPVDPANEGRLVHLNGPLVTTGPVTDTDFAIAAPGLQLVRKVEMFQWVETARTEKKVELGGSETQVTTYSYDRQWSDNYKDSSKFNEVAGHRNPEMLVNRQSFLLPSAKLGDFELDQTVLGNVGGTTQLVLTEEQGQSVQHAVGAGMRASIVNGGIYLGYNSASPQVGDYRISYDYVPLDSVSIVGKQQANGIAAYRTEGGDNLLMVSNGNVAAADMFEDAASGNASMTWIVRLLGIALLIAGFGAVLGPISVLASVLPFLGSIVGFGTGIIAGIAGIGIGALTIGSAWLFYRPLLALAIFAVAALIIVGFVFLGRKKKAAADTTQAA